VLATFVWLASVPLSVAGDIAIPNDELDYIYGLLIKPGELAAFRESHSGVVSLNSVNGDPQGTLTTLAAGAGIGAAKECGLTSTVPAQGPDIVVQIFHSARWTLPDVVKLLHRYSDAGLQLSPGALENSAKTLLGALNEDDVATISITGAASTGARRETVVLVNRLGAKSTDGEDAFIAFRSSFGYPIGGQPIENGLFGFFIGGGKLGNLVADDATIPAKICRALNLTYLFCHSAEVGTQGMTKDQLRSSLEVVAASCGKLESGEQ